MSQTTRAQHRFDVLVIGGGPAGMAAAARAAGFGCNVGIVDDNFQLGGQIWRSDSQDTPQSSEARTWTERLRAARTTILCGMRVVHLPEPGLLFAEGPDGLHELAYEKLILATGARERFLPFPGWTLQNVMGAGGLQALVKCGLPVAGKRVMVAGTGLCCWRSQRTCANMARLFQLFASKRPGRVWPGSQCRWSGSLRKLPRHFS